MDKPQMVIAGAVIALLFGAAGFWLGRNAQPGALPAFNTYSSIKEPILSVGGLDVSEVTLVGGNSISVNGQPPGSMVDIQMIALAKDGWVVIHDERDGKPGNILGARRFNAGQSQSGAVELLRSTEDGKAYFAMLHSDDGDRQFDHKVDLPLTDTQGNIISMRFLVLSGAKEQ